MRAGRIEPAADRTLMDALTRVGVDTDDPHDDARSAMSIAPAHALHVQDAMDVETGRRCDAPLVSADLARLRAAEASKVVAVRIPEVPAWIPDDP